MKKLFIILFFPFISLAQNKIDPPPIVTDTTGNYDVIDPVQHKFKQHIQNNAMTNQKNYFFGIYFYILLELIRLLF